MSTSISTIFENGIYIPEATAWLNGRPVNSKLPEHTRCAACTAKPCKVSASPGEQLCPAGLSYYTYTIAGSKLVLYGIMGEKSDHTDKSLKKTSKGRGYPKNIADTWVAKLSNYIAAIDKQVEEAKSEVLHYFHDAVKWANQINISAEKIVEKNQGDTFSDQLENATSEIKSLYQASNMLVDSFQLTSIYFNPESARYGETLNCEIYKLFDKVQAIIYHSEGKKYNKRFKIKGRTHRRISVYESFPIIALCLIQNAMKYSKSPDIEIHIEERDPGLHLNVVSEGPYLDDTEITEIFKKGVRGKYARRLHHDGLGIGLYVAQKVALAHNFLIAARSTPQNYTRDQMPMAVNEFSFTIAYEGVK